MIVGVEILIEVQVEKRGRREERGGLEGCEAFWGMGRMRVDSKTDGFCVEIRGRGYGWLETLLWLEFMEEGWKGEGEGRKRGKKRGEEMRGGTDAFLGENRLRRGYG